MKKSKELEITTLFDEKNLQRVSPYADQEFNLENCTNKVLTCLITDKTEKSYIGKLFGQYRDNRKVYCAIYVKGKKIDAYFCGTEKQVEITEVLEKFSEACEFELKLIKQEKETIPLKEFRDRAFGNRRLWWVKLFRFVSREHD